ncbi:MAG: threonylcarbamoyl-AMP synthase [Spirochaetaceae bacterium]|jgi:L-threonylcarbamoyladenylate synthase|nr:threonylcarbamoyl-AMP synthase [Spirochaetaceae bacterium]
MPQKDSGAGITRIMPATVENIAAAAAAITEGRLVAFPTETVYGLGADAFNPAALACVFEVKNRPSFDPLIVHIAAYGALEKISNLALVSPQNRVIMQKLIENLWPGPLTLIVPKRPEVPGLVSGGLNTVAVRFPAHPVARQLIQAGPPAVAAPSANPFGYLSPTRAEHVAEQLNGKIDIILDGGKTEFGIESTVLDICGDSPRILRHGGTSVEQIEALIGPVAASLSLGNASPGCLLSHYAPLTKLYLYTPREIQKVQWNTNAAYLFYSELSRREYRERHGAPSAENLFALCSTDNTSAAAARLFDTLHLIDALKYAFIYAECAPANGLGNAINERLYKAAGSVITAGGTG